MATAFGPRLLGRIEVLFFATVAVAAAGVFAYQHYVVAPAQACEGSGNWWDPKTRTCGHVVYLPDLTHRPIGSKAPRYPTLPDSAAAGASDSSGVR